MIIGRLLVVQRLTAAGHVNTFHRANIYLLESRQEEIKLFNTKLKLQNVLYEIRYDHKAY